jgi:hypothetical protein
VVVGLILSLSLHFHVYIGLRLVTVQLSDM